MITWLVPFLWCWSNLGFGLLELYVKSAPPHPPLAGLLQSLMTDTPTYGQLRSMAVRPVLFKWPRARGRETWSCSLYIPINCSHMFEYCCIPVFGTRRKITRPLKGLLRFVMFLFRVFGETKHQVSKSYGRGKMSGTLLLDRILPV